MGPAVRSKLAATVRNYRTTAAVDAKVLCSDPIDSICPEILKANGHSVDVPPGDKPIPAADLKKMIGQYDALIVRRFVRTSLVSWSRFCVWVSYYMGLSLFCVHGGMLAMWAS